MRRSLRLALLGALSWLAAALAPAGAFGAAAPQVIAVELHGDIGPASAVLVHDALARARGEHAAALVILLDTQGGGAASTDDIVRAERASQVPLIAYVAPAGAHAAAAGVFVAMAADVAAMAPGTHIGSATPSDSGGRGLGGGLRRSVRDDAEAAIAALARAHGRDACMARLGVRGAARYGAREALAGGLVDRVAPTLPALLRELDGTPTAGGHVLHTAGARVEAFEAPWTLRLLGVLTGPWAVDVLFLAGVAGLAYERFHPGLILPGTLGAITLVLALFGLSLAPITPAGAALAALGVALLLLASRAAGRGLAALAGVVALAAGGLLLDAAPGVQAGVSPLTLTLLALACAAALAAVVTRVAAARRPSASRRAVGSRGLVGQTAIVRTPLTPHGRVLVRGELWKAEAGGAHIGAGEAVVVDEVRGSTLHVSAHSAASD